MVHVKCPAWPWECSGDSSGYNYHSTSEWWLSGLLNHLLLRKLNLS